MPSKYSKQQVKTQSKGESKIRDENNRAQLEQQSYFNQIQTKIPPKQFEQSPIAKPKTIQKETIKINEQKQLDLNKQQISNILPQQTQKQEQVVLTNNKNIPNNSTKATPTPPVETKSKKVEEDENSFNPYDMSFSDDSSTEKIAAPVKPIVTVIQQNIKAPQKQSQPAAPAPQPKVEAKPEVKKNDFGFDDISEDESDGGYKPPSTSKQAKKEEEEEEEIYEEYDDDFEQSEASSVAKVDYQKADLNKLSKEELDKHKAIMDKDFSKNQKKPGDKDFVYDKRIEFEQNLSNDWDDDL